MSFADILLLALVVSFVAYLFVDWRRNDASPVPRAAPADAAGEVEPARGQVGGRVVEVRRGLPAGKAQIPAASSLPEPRRAAPAPEPVVPRAADLLIVDDSAVARAKLRRLFESAGYTVQLANDGVEALLLLGKARYGLMLTDLEMPRMDGVALIARCRGGTRTRRMPIVAISGHESLRARFNDCPEVAGIHPKPWSDEVLLGHVGTLVQGRRALREPELAA
jgi:CheY-like chemotaxis protein